MAKFIAPWTIQSMGYPRCKDLLTIVVKQREQRWKNNEEKNSNSFATKKNMTGFYTEYDASVSNAAHCRHFCRDFTIFTSSYKEYLSLAGMRQKWLLD